MKISIITLFPEMLKPFFDDSIIRRAKEKGVVEIELINLRDFALDEHGTVDDRPYGGGAGMVLMVEPIMKAMKYVIPSKEGIQEKSGSRIGVRDDRRVILASAKGKPYSQKKAQELSKNDHLVIIAGHYEGVDERVMKYVDEEISIGDFVLTGGELPAAMIVDSVVRLIPDVLKKDEATQEESFFEVPLDELIEICGSEPKLTKLKLKGINKVRLLEYPHYTRPHVFKGEGVPAILITGDHEKIRRWRIKQAYKETLEKRPDLLDKRS
ncbi:tRNA (guanosine(37)-N1)-methyltransferase TrmD [Candidatus Roizmanbacteria bacterium RIFCSPLOWO2_01_FULL_38_12]|uniref:tRNA (guanine-N(1)-)-methyltransferase n=1 Tax=Candidatus Roizmanbacteria bacterium RIFCSPLOWO2_01_FULL_38_12 TaxID=1802061 RepID=A0A1F7IY16_9BACT|nr:MAG: tRNA (guanosine(37)-N1)-methyltransferase TrmD [Candidatus Roizmanbacteria bacterium RIFCSPHIGHO2_01_FULL_38_15]OGK34441.1 MAG: tRNA (guanosine(37)-N1)-methyltransferase TrmD [Candidatus Roizmanbacteria bacterium RIFCSPHIGHO2_12_FULL_38_13]OGK48270.1 MAG: tRNA (guanosine(37)-N1)-methyltransferase TrmD [Candidatus Roizmanbacteria bacterium RIFCSPLOWO2_01_FULL_38_12]